METDVKESEKSLEEAKKNLQEKEEEERALKATVEERKRKLAKRAQNRNWAAVNKRALQANQLADLEANKSQKEGTSLTSSGKKEEKFNPYARRKIKPKILWEVGRAKEGAGDARASPNSPGRSALSTVRPPNQGAPE